MNKLTSTTTQTEAPATVRLQEAVKAYEQACLAYAVAAKNFELTHADIWDLEWGSIEGWPPALVRDTQRMELLNERTRTTKTAMRRAWLPVAMENPSYAREVAINHMIG